MKRTTKAILIALGLGLILILAGMFYLSRVLYGG